MKKVAIFQWSNKFYTVLRFFFRFPVECFSKHPQTRHDILNAITQNQSHQRSPSGGTIVIVEFNDISNTDCLPLVTMLLINEQEA